MNYDIGIVKRRRIISGSDGYFSVPPAAAVATTTWNQSDKSADVTLTGSFLIATTTASSGFRGGVRGTTSHTTGKWVFEVTIALNANGLTVGIGKSTASLTGNVGGDADGYGFAAFQGIVLNNGGTVATYTGAVSGDVIGIAYDGTGGSETVTFYKNGSAMGAPISVGAGPWFPMFAGSHDNTFGDDAGTINCGQSAFVGTYPGVSAWG